MNASAHGASLVLARAQFEQKLKHACISLFCCVHQYSFAHGEHWPVDLGSVLCQKLYLFLFALLIDYANSSHVFEIALFYIETHLIYYKAQVVEIGPQSKEAVEEGQLSWIGPLLHELLCEHFVRLTEVERGEVGLIWVCRCI